MGVTSHIVESKSPIAPARMFKALFVDSHNLLPKIVPDAIKSIEIIEGDGGAGTIKKINFNEGKYLKNRIDSVDEENLVIKYSLLIEGNDPRAEKIKAISFETKIEGGSEGGSVSKTKVEIHTVGEAISEEELKGGLSEVEPASLLVAAVEAYLLQNTDVYA